MNKTQKVSVSAPSGAQVGDVMIITFKNPGLTKEGSDHSWDLVKEGDIVSFRHNKSCCDLPIQVVQGDYWADYNEEFKTIRAMQDFGGSFVKGLVKLYIVADSDNKVKLINSFKDYFDDYKLKGAKWLSKTSKTK